MLALYVDETKDSEMFLVCGLLADVDDWAAFSIEWDDVLSHPDGQLPFWHQSDAYACQPPFDALTPEQRMRREVLLRRILSKWRPQPLGMRMEMAVFTAQVRSQVQPPLFVDQRIRSLAIELSDPPYWFLHAGWIEQLRRVWSLRGYTDKVRIIIEKSDRTRHDHAIRMALDAMDEMYRRSGWDSPIQSVTHEKGKQSGARPLEAVDMYAWAVRRRMTDRRLRRRGSAGLKPHHLAARLPDEHGWNVLDVRDAPVVAHVEDMNGKWIWGPHWQEWFDERYAELEREEAAEARRNRDQ